MYSSDNWAKIRGTYLNRTHVHKTDPYKSITPPWTDFMLTTNQTPGDLCTVNSRYSGPLNCGHLDIAATYLGTDLKLHQDCTNLASDLSSPRYSVLQPLLETPISAIVFILQPEVIFVGVVMVKT